MFPSTSTKNVEVNNIKGINGNKIAQKIYPNDVEAQCKGVLRRYDANGDGRLSKKELKAAFKGAGSSMPGWRAFRAFCHADKNGDGFISEAELPGVLKYASRKGYLL